MQSHTYTINGQIVNCTTTGSAPIAGKQLVLSISGYSSRLSEFARDDPRNILEALENFVPDAGDSQIRAWRDSIKILQGACEELCSVECIQIAQFSSIYDPA